jgi:hypothetical protein
MGPATNIPPSRLLKLQDARFPKLTMLLLLGFIWIIIVFGQQWSNLSKFSKPISATFDGPSIGESSQKCSDDNKTEIPKDEERNVAQKNDRFIRDFANGVDPVYLELLEVAERKSAADFETSHQRGDRGVAIGPTDGNFDYSVKALQNAKRIRYILGNDRSVKIALMTSKEHLTILSQECSDKPGQRLAEACRLWANNTLFDDVIVPKDNEFRGNDNHTEVHRGTSNHWLKALGGYRLAPYTRTMFLDSDAYPCPGFEKLFDLVLPVAEWQIPSEAPADLAIGIEQWVGGATLFWNPGDDHVYQDFKYFRKRNTGVVLFHFHSQTAHTLAHFIPLVSEHIFNYVATPNQKVVNDQTPFRTALFLFKRLVPEFNEQQFPMHSSCRSYPGMSYAGVDGFKNGMFPIQQDRKPCNECFCTPCRIVHTRIYNVYINGQLGWEENLDPIGFNITEYLGVGGY